MLQKTKRMAALVVGIGLASIAQAQSTDTFTATGNLATPRQFHTSTLLLSGMALIAGGRTNCASLASAELYNPSTGTFSAGGEMITARHMHTATLLPSGKVLIAGGILGQDATFNCVSSSLYRAELYDPATGTFSPTGDMTTARSLHTATLLNNGKVLIAGGSSFETAEIYDPSTGTFTATGNMTEPGADTATLLANGKVLITRSTQFFQENHADLYDPASGTFTRTGDMIDPDQGQQPMAMLLANGKVLLAGGGRGDFGGSTSAEIYDTATGTFSATGKMTAGIDVWQAAATLPDGTVLISGESSRMCGSNSGSCGTTLLYDPETGTFSAPSDSLSEEGHAATLLLDGTVLLSGGWAFCAATPIGVVLPGCGGTLAGAQIYHPGVLVPAPQLFSVSGDGRGQGAVWHATTGAIASPGNPAVAGEVLAMYTTSLIEGGVIPPQVAMGGQLAEILFFGDAPGYPGYNQVNFRVPDSVAQGSAVSIRLNYLSRSSNEVTLTVR